MMKTIIHILIMTFFSHSIVFPQCGINYKEILKHSCEGIYLQHQELNEESGAKVSMILERDNRYAIYLLNPNFSIPSLIFEGNSKSLCMNFKTQVNPKENYSVYSFTAAETGDYYFSLDFGTEKGACVLLAIYLQNDAGLKAGIYRNFEEFKYNNPAVDFNFQISKKLRKYGDVRSRGKITYYRIKIDPAMGNSIGKVFGFCDGTDIYINDRNPRLDSRTEFIRIENYGRYCYFEDRTPTTVFIGMVPATIYSLERKILDTETGEIVGLNKNRLEEILADDSDLHAEFINDPDKSKKLKEYLIKYLEK